MTKTDPAFGTSFRKRKCFQREEEIGKGEWEKISKKQEETSYLNFFNKAEKCIKLFTHSHDFNLQTLEKIGISLVN
jgi:hypothetical protein